MENLKEKKSIIDFISRRNKFAIDPTTLSMLGFSTGDYFFDKRVGDGLFTIGVFFGIRLSIELIYQMQKKKRSGVRTTILIKDLKHLVSVFEKTTGQKFKI